MLEDPSAATIYRVSGEAPFPDPANPALPPTIVPRHVTLRDRQTVATVIPFASRHQVPDSLLRYLNDQFNKEIEGGDTYPMMNTLPLDKFARYWFQNFGGIMLLGDIESAEDLVEGKDWAKECLGTFYIKPNYPGRSSHVCNAGFIVTDASRNRGVGRLMGETYLEWAPKLGYTYSVFNLVYDTNVASCKIWDALGFKRIGRVKGAGNLKSHPDRLVDAIIFGRDLGDAAGGVGSEELVSEERFDKIKFYLKYGRYPNGADRAEKSRLRSATMHYKLLEGDILMLKDKEVISDPQRQYEIAQKVHNQSHAGINKSTATIAEHYHWSRIKETVSDVIRNCYECKELGKASASQAQQPSPAGVVNGLKRPNPDVTCGAPGSKRAFPSPSSSAPLADSSNTGLSRPPLSSLPDPAHLSPFSLPSHHQFADSGEDIPMISSLAHPLARAAESTMTNHHGTIGAHAHSSMLQDNSLSPLHPPSHHHHHQHQHQHQHHHNNTGHPPVALPPLSDPHVSVSVQAPVSVYQPIDPQIISQPPGTSGSHAHNHVNLHPHHHNHHHYPSFDDHSSSHHQHHGHDPDAVNFQALLNSTDDDVVGVVNPSTTSGSHHHNHNHHGGHEHHPPRTQEEDDAERAAVDRDMEMLIEQPQEDEEEDALIPQQQQQQQQQHHHQQGQGQGQGYQQSRAHQITGSLAMIIDGVGPNADNHGSLGSSSGGGSTGVGSGSGVSVGVGRSGGGSGGKMNVSHLLSTHDDDDKDYDIPYDGVGS